MLARVFYRTTFRNTVNLPQCFENSIGDGIIHGNLFDGIFNKHTTSDERKIKILETKKRRPLWKTPNNLLLTKQSTSFWCNSAMETVVTSPNDTRKYRALTLQNGLKVLLIADLKSLEESLSHNEDDSTDAESLPSDSEDEAMEHSGESGTEGGDEDSSDELGQRKRKNSSEKMSAASLCIGTGSFSDPEDIPGLAHFLEHMVFLGSEKYPEENHFDSFLKEHGGTDNAYTDCERTVFYFDVRKKHFREALDIFAQFFIKPLMTKDSVDREIKAVDSEFDMSKPNDKNRKEQLLASFASDGHPMGKFTWGNIDSLKTTPSSKGIDIYERLQSFHKNQYSSAYMTLAVQSKDELDVQEQWVREIFSEIPNNGNPKVTFQKKPEPFNSGKFYKLYKVVPVQNINHVEFTWSWPSFQQHYRIKPLYYLDWVIGHEGKGSILSYLKKMYWATKLDCGNSESGFEHNTTCALFTIGVTLTELGMDNITEVMNAIFEYLAMLRRVGPQERIYDEIKQISANNFRWSEQGEPVDYVDSMCVNMQLYPVEDYITGDELMFQYDHKLIDQCINYFVPSKANLCISSNRYEKEANCNKKEKWYQTAYGVEEIPESWISHWENIEPREEIFHLPPPNEFIASDFDIKEADVFASAYPLSVTDTAHSRLWYKKDTKFKVPRAYCNFMCVSPLINQSPFTRCALDLFIKALNHTLNEVAYAADLASLSYNVKSSTNAFIIKVSGFNHKLFTLFTTICDLVRDFDISDELFVAVKEDQRKSYYNNYIRPSELARDIRLQILQDNFWTVVDKQNVLDDITKPLLLQFVKQLKAEIFVEGLVQGNCTVTEAKEFESYLLTTMDSRPLRNNVHPHIRVCEIPVGQWYCRAENFNSSDNNSVIVNYYQHGPVSIKQFCLNDLLTMKMEEPCFDILRTREQLGYEVFNMNRCTESIVAFSVDVTSQIDKFGMQQLDDRIEAFLIEFEGILDRMTAEEFNTAKESLIGLKKCEDTYLGQEVKRNWHEIMSETYVYDRITKEISALESITQEELLNWYKSHVLGSGQCRKLSVQVQGHVPSESNRNESNVISEEEQQQIPHNHHTCDSMSNPVVKYVTIDTQSNRTVIMDPIKFKLQNKLYPLSKIIH